MFRSDLLREGEFFDFPRKEEILHFALRADGESVEYDRKDFYNVLLHENVPAFERNDLLGDFPKPCRRKPSENDEVVDGFERNFVNLPGLDEMVDHSVYRGRHFRTVGKIALFKEGYALKIRIREFFQYLSPFDPVCVGPGPIVSVLRIELFQPAYRNEPYESLVRSGNERGDGIVDSLLFRIVLSESDIPGHFESFGNGSSNLFACRKDLDDSFLGSGFFQVGEMRVVDRELR